MVYPTKSHYLSNSGSCFASGFSSAHFKYRSDSPNLLIATGIRCVIIQSLGNSPIESVSDIFACLWGRGLHNLPNNYSYVAGKSLLGANAWTMALGLLQERFPDVLGYQTFQDLIKFVIEVITIAAWKENGMI